MKSILAFAAFFLLQHAALADSIKAPLQKFTAMSKMELHCIDGMQTVSIPVPERWKLNKVTLDLRYTASSSLIPDISQLVVKVNGSLVAQMKPNRQGDEVANLIDIPVELLKPGYNTISFQAAQHYMKDGCEQTCAPGLWTDISLKHTTLEMDYDLKPVPMKLGMAASWAFDPKLFPEASVNLIADMSSAEGATDAAVAASGIARRFDYRKVSFTHSLDIKPDVDNVLIGKTAFVGALLLKYGILLEATQAGFIKIYYLPKSDGGKDGLHVLFVVTGNDAKALKIASETFANMSLPYPGVDSIHAYSFAMPNISMYGGRGELTPDKKLDFKTLGMSPLTFQGMGAVANGPSSIDFRLPPDFLIKQNEYAKLVLNFSYGSGLLQDSALAIEVNGTRVHDIHLSNQDGSYLSDYKVEIPTYLFKPGKNTISFNAFLNTQHKLCDLVNENGPFVTVFDNSTLYFPPMPHFVKMPKLELFTLNGFPFTRWPDGYKTLIYLPKHDDASIDTALDLVGMITQKNGFPLFGTSIVYSNPGNWDGEMMVIGKVQDIPKHIMSEAPFQPEGVADIPYPVSRGWNTQTSVAISKQQGGLGSGMGLLMEFQSSSNKGRSVIVASAQTDEGLEKLGDALLSPTIQNGIEGDVALVKLDVPDYDVASFKVGKEYSTGNAGEISSIDYVLYAYPYIFYGLVALSIVLLGLVAYWLMRRYRKKRTKVTSDEKRE